MKQNKIPRNEYIRKPVGKTNPYKHDVLYTNLGQWKYPGQVTRIPSNDITMQGVPYPVYGEDDLGYGQMMYPGMDYTFPGQYVTEIPMAQKGLNTLEDPYKKYYNIPQPKSLAESPAWRAYTYGKGRSYHPIHEKEWVFDNGNFKGIKEYIAPYAKFDEVTGFNYQIDPETMKPFGDIDMEGDKRFNLQRFIINPYMGQVQTKDLGYKSKKGSYEDMTWEEPFPQAKDPNEQKGNIFKDLYIQNLVKYKGNRDEAYKASTDFMKKRVEPLFEGAWYKFNTDPNTSSDDIALINPGGSSMSVSPENIRSNIHYRVFSKYSDDLKKQYGVKSQKELENLGVNTNLNDVVENSTEFKKELDRFSPILEDYYIRHKGFSPEEAKKEVISKLYTKPELEPVKKTTELEDLQDFVKTAELAGDDEWLKRAKKNLDNYLKKQKDNKPKEAYGGDPSLPNITGHYETGGWLDQYQKKGEKQPIYVTDPNDPRLKAYEDSLKLFNFNPILAESLFKVYKAHEKAVKSGNAVQHPSGVLIGSGGPAIDEYSREVDRQSKLLSKYGVNSQNYKSKIFPSEKNPNYKDTSGFPSGLTKDNMLEMQWKNPVQPYILKEPKKPQPKKTDKETPIIYTDYNEYLKAKKSYDDSLNVRKKSDQTFNPGSKTRPLTKEEKEYWKDEKTGLLPYLVEYNPANPGAGYFGHFKKPVVKPEYKKIEEPVKKEETKKQVVVKTPKDYDHRQQEFSGNWKIMRYFDKAGKELYRDIDYGGGKVERQKMQKGGWLDEYQPGGRVMPSETTQSFIPAGLRYKMDQLKKQDPKQKQKLAEEKKYYEDIAKAKEDARKQEIADRKARIADSIEAQKESVIGNPNWREVLARQTQATGDKFRVSDEPNFFDDYINPGVWIGDMASSLGQAPYAAKESNSNLPYALAIGAPLLTGALEGIGGKSTKDFLTNIISPVPFTGEMINKGLNKIGKTAKNASKYFNKKVSATPFKSEIDWSKWNPETPKYPELINEYNTIEESTKKAGTWMKNADGTPYKGSPEQFVQEQSSHFKKAYPQGYDETFRGVGATNTNPDFSKGSDLSYTPPELTGDRSIFTADYDLAKIYAFGEKNPQMLNPFSEKGKPGVFNLIHPKGKQIEINTLFDDWQNVDLRKANKAHLQADLNNKKLHLQKMINNPYANEKIIEKHKKYIDDLQKNIDEFDSRITDAEELSKLRANIATVPSTDDIAAYLPKSDLRKVTLRNLIDGAPGDVTIVNNKPGNYLKSRIGNVGFFDMTNPNIYKALVPAAIAAGAYQQQEEGGSIGEDEFRRGGLYTPPKIKRKAKKYGTSKNIQSSINKLFTRNYDVFGPGGKNIYNPKAYKTGGWLDFVD